MERMTISLPRPLPASAEHPMPGLSASQAVLRALAYSDIFDQAQSITALYAFLEAPDITPELFQQTLQTLQTAGMIARDGDLVTLAGREALVNIWQQRQKQSARKWRAAQRYTALIRCLPFVRMVAITGSLAVHNAEAPDDIDLFLIAEPGRVWLTRALTIIVVRLAALSRVTLCPNYLIASDALELTERNLYTARELTQMQPLYGMLCYRRLRASNRWTGAYLPNAGSISAPAARSLDYLPAFALLSKALGEHLLGGRVGETLERWEMRRKVRKLLRTHPDGAAEEASFSPAICKGHFNGHAARILCRFSERVEQLPPIEEG
jgi:hypothetical protein